MPEPLHYNLPLSIGTGSRPTGFEVSKRHQGLLFWGGNFAKVTDTGSGNSIHERMKAKKIPHYYRIDKELEYFIPLDVIDDGLTKKIMDIGSGLAAKNSKMIRRQIIPKLIC